MTPLYEPISVPNKRRRRRLAPMGCGLLIVALFAAGVWLNGAVQRARDAAVASAAQGPLNQLQLAFLNYHDTYGCFPPAYIADDAGNRLHSWRALILPYVDGAELYREYDFSEPWNGPNNRRLADRMARIFHSPSEPDSDRFTNYVVIVGPDTAFPGSNTTTLHDFEDGPEQTILLAEISNSNIEWLEPRDLDVETMSFHVNDKSGRSISTSRRNGTYVVFADNINTHSLPEEFPPDVLRALTTIRGREPVFMFKRFMQSCECAVLSSPGVGAVDDAFLARFRHWDEVTRVWLTDSRVTDVGLAHLTKSRGLGTLHLSRTPITDDGLENLRGRTYFYMLDLSGTKITDAGLEHLQGIVNMHYLNVRNTLVTAEGIDRLKQRLPDLTVVD
jgi:hypothetical protein